MFPKLVSKASKGCVCVFLRRAEPQEKTCRHPWILAFFHLDSLQTAKIESFPSPYIYLEKYSVKEMEWNGLIDSFSISKLINILLGCAC